MKAPALSLLSALLLTGCKPNQAPVISSPAGFPFCRAGDSAEFVATAADPEGDSVAIRFCWEEGDTSTWSPLLPSGDSARAAHRWVLSDTYYVRAQARDSRGSLSGWSAPLAVTNTFEGETLWSRREIPVWSSACPAIGADGTLYVPCEFGLYCLGPDGIDRWRYTGTVYSGASLGPDGTIFFLKGFLQSESLVALNPDGSERWRFGIGEEAYSTPAIASDGTVYVGTIDNNLFAVSSGGALKWKRALGSYVWSTPAIGPDGTIYVASDESLHAINPDGTQKWARRGGGEEYYGLALGADGTVYYRSWSELGSGLLAVAPDGTLKWLVAMGKAYSPPVVGPDGTIYVGSYVDSCLYAVDASGSLRWRLPLHDRVLVSPAVAEGGWVYVATMHGVLYAVLPDGTTRWVSDTGWYLKSGAMTIGPDGTVYIAGRDHGLFAVRGASPLAQSPWPKINHDLRNTGRVGGP